MQFFEPFSCAVCECSVYFLQNCFDEQLTPHTDAAMKKGIRDFNAFAAQREPPSQNMFIVAIQEGAVKIEEYGWMISPGLRVTILFCFSSRGGSSSHKRVNSSVLACFS